MVSSALPIDVRVAAAATPFRRVVCAVNGNRSSAEAVRQALALTSPDGSLTCVAVTDERGTGPNAQATLTEPHAAEALKAALRLARPAGIEVGREIARGGDVRQAIVEFARGYDLLVVGAHGRSRAAGMLLGSTASFAAHASPVPVLVVRQRPEIGFPGTVVAGSAGASDDATVEVAARLAAAHGASLVIGHVGGRDSREVRHALAEQCARATELTGTEPVVVASPGNPPDRLAALADSTSAALVVVGSRGLHGVAALASVSERVAHRAPCSVLVLRGG